MAYTPPNLTGNLYGDLLVIGRAPNRKHCTAWYCQCAVCDQTHVVRADNLKRHGCKCPNIPSKRPRLCLGQHSASPEEQRTKEFATWRRGMNRCLNPQSRDYKEYGAKGVKWAEEWMTYETFLDDMGRAPSPAHSIDRIYGTDYGPGLARWATPKEQARNRSNNRVVTYGGQTKCLIEMCEDHGWDYRKVYIRMYYGAPFEVAIRDQLEVLAPSPVSAELPMFVQGTENESLPASICLPLYVCGF